MSRADDSPKERKKTRAAPRAAASKTASKAAASKPATPRAAASKPASKAAASKEQEAVSLVRGLAEIIDAHALSEVIYDTPALTITLRRSAGPAAAVVAHAVPSASAPPPLVVAPAPAEPVAVPERDIPDAGKGDNLHTVTSPFVGTFYRRPGPESEPYAEIGSRVERGQVLCIVEAMKLMNEIEADVTGSVVDILVDDGKPVEYGQPLFKIAPA